MQTLQGQPPGKSRQGTVSKSGGTTALEPRIVPHRIERCERELPTDIVDVYELTI